MGGSLVEDFSRSPHCPPAAEKMTRLTPLVLGLAALLVPGLALELDNLKEVVTQLWNSFKPNPEFGRVPIFSLAVRVPTGPGSGRFDISQITDPSEEVRKTIDNDCGRDIYVSRRLVAARALRKRKGKDRCKSSETRVFGHAESRVLQKFPWLEPEGPELMLFYTSSSPCSGVCTNICGPYNILEKIKVITKWPSHAVVFSDIFQPLKAPPIPEDHLVQSLKNLAASVGRGSIFRCSQGRCRKCFDNNKRVVRFCVQDEKSDSSPVSRSGLTWGTAA